VRQVGLGRGGTLHDRFRDWPSLNWAMNSYAVAYSSLSELRQAATSAALFAPPGVPLVSDETRIPIMITTVRMLELLAGDLLPSTFELWQAGAIASANNRRKLVGALRPVTQGHIYLAYLKPFPLQRGQLAIAGSTSPSTVCREFTSAPEARCPPTKPKPRSHASGRRSERCPRTCQ
jgi:hypothetical protein